MDTEKPFEPISGERVLELANVLFLDLVAFSELSTDDQADTIGKLQEIVRSVLKAVSPNNLNTIVLPTGDGMALAFFGDPMLPAVCARQIATELKQNPKLQVRMGLHTGPVYNVCDVNGKKNLAGDGINLAQRVMNAGSAGHILTSKTYADILVQFGSWKSALHDLGEVRVKHDHAVHLFNLYDADFGNPQTPRSPVVSRVLRNIWGIGLLAGIALLLVSWWMVAHKPQGPPPEARKWYERGTEELRAGTYLSAANALEMAIGSYPTFVLAHARIADAWNELDYSSKAKDEMLEASNLVDAQSLPTRDKRYVEAVRKTVTRDFKGAVSDYKTILNSLPAERRAEGDVDLGRAYEKNGEIDKAISAYRAAAALDAQSPAPFLRLAVLLSRRKQSAEAESNFARAEQIYQASSNLEGIAEVAFQRGNDANTQSRLDDARKYLQRSMNAADEVGNIQLRIRALTRLAVTEYMAGNSDASIQLANQAIALAEDKGLEYWTIDASIRLANAYISRRDYDKAGSGLERAITLAQRGDHPRLLALAQRSLAQVRQKQNRFADAARLAQAALDYYRPAGFVTESIECLTYIVRAQRDAGNLQLALKFAGEQLSLAQKVNQPRIILLAEESLGSVLLRLERYPESSEHFEKALAAARPPSIQTDYEILNCAEAAWRMGHYDAAVQILGSLTPASLKNAGISVYLLEIRVAMLISRERYKEARELIRKALADKANDDPGLFDRFMCQVETNSGSRRSAPQWCQEALSRAQADSDNFSVPTIKLTLANAYLAGGSPDAAEPLAEAARSAFAAAGRRESELFSLAALAGIAFANKDFPEAQSFSKKALDILSEFEHNWLPRDYKTYLSRPDVRDLVSRISRLAQ